MPRVVSERVGASRAERGVIALPAHVAPMLAVSSDLPTDGANYSFEWKWDGVRAIAYADRRVLRLDGRQGNDISIRYPELHPMRAALGKHTAVLDGEIVALDDGGQPSFARLQQRMHVTDPAMVARVARTVPVLYVIFDLMYLDGRSLIEAPYSDRRSLLEKLVLAGENWHVTTAYVNRGKEMLDTARRTRLEGIVAKRLDSRYEPGRRSPAWRKIKVIQRQEFVVGGWIPEAGTRSGRVGAMLIGYYDGEAFRYAGRVGTGLRAADHALLMPMMLRNRRAASPFADVVSPAGVHFTRPAIVIEVEYRRWPQQGLVQQAAYKGVRRDKLPRDVVKEPMLGA